jgi:hypothetical protein
LLQQVDVFCKWWAAGEAQCSIGLPNRFVFSFGAAQEPGPPNLANFGSDVVLPKVRRAFIAALTLCGPHAPVCDRKELLEWQFDHAAEKAVYLYRVECYRLSKRTRLGKTLASSFNKAAYWLAQQSLFTTLMQQLWPSIITGERPAALQATALSHSALKASMEFFAVRVLFGMAVLAVDILHETWCAKQKRITDGSRFNEQAANLLRACCGSCVDMHCAVRAGAPFHDLRATKRRKRDCGMAALLEAFNFLAVRGLGESKGEPPVFWKRHHMWL